MHFLQSIETSRSPVSTSQMIQAAINIVGHYGRRYHVIFSGDKTKVTITGSKPT